MSKIASGHECTKYDFLEVTDPASLMIRGKNEDINIEDCNNIAQLHLLYVFLHTINLRMLVC